MAMVWNFWMYFALCSAIIGAVLAVGVVFFAVQWIRKGFLFRGGDLELQQLGLSIRTTTDAKVSLEGLFQDLLDGQIISTTPHKTLVESYPAEDLKKATNSFSVSNLIEGSVYHGRINGKEVAIKRTDAETVSKIEFGLFQDAIHQHPNIMRLLGTSMADGSTSYLVYEYAKNGSLKDWIHGGMAMKSQFIASCSCSLTWTQRLKICLDVAMALQFMHHIMNPSYVHGNVKSRNIFLDEECNAKIGNFGMPACHQEEEIEEIESGITHPASWSKGYLAPEHLEQGTISANTDIFAYGVVLLEVLSGKTPITIPKTSANGEGATWLSKKIKTILKSENPDKIREWMDRALGENYSFDAAVTLANLARACTEDDPALRPTAGEIVEKLSRLVDELPEGEHNSMISESSSKPLVNSVASR